RKKTLRLAGEWFASQGEVEDALRCWIDAGELDAAADLIGERLHELVQHDLAHEVLPRWLARLPAGAANGRAPLLLAHAYLRHSRWDMTGVARLLDQTEKILEEAATQEENGRSRFKVDLETLRCCQHYWQGNPEGALDFGLRALETASKTEGALFSLA